MKFSLSIVLTLFSLIAVGQSMFPNDSLIWQIPAQRKLQFHLAHPNLVRLQQKDFKVGEAELSHHYKTGEYRRAKDAYQQHVAAFDSYGISQIDSFIVSGRFSFNKIWEDSLANSLRGLEDDLSPYYYFVQKAGRYERQNFEGNVQVRYAGLSSYLQPGLKFDYQMHWTTRSVDPRPNVASVAIKFNPFISADFGNDLLSVGAMYGYGEEETNITYKNTMFATSMLYPDRIYYTNQGFGYIAQKDSSTMRNYDQYWGGNISYSLRRNRIDLFADVEFQKKVTNSTFDLKRREVYAKRSEFTLQTLKGVAQLQIGDPQNVHNLVDLAVEFLNGQDFNYNIRSTNYLVSSSLIDIDYGYHKQATSVGIGTSYWSAKKSDAAAAHEHSYQQMQLRLVYRKLFSLGRDFFETELIPNYTFKLSNRLIVPETQVNVFTTSIVYPDYDYFNLQPLGVNLNLGYIMPKLLHLRGAKLFINNRFLAVIAPSHENFLSLEKHTYTLWQSYLGVKFSL